MWGSVSEDSLMDQSVSDHWSEDADDTRSVTWTNIDKNQTLSNFLHILIVTHPAVILF